MFKLISNTEVWEALYTSRLASESLKHFMPEEPIYDEGPIAVRAYGSITIERLILRPYGHRPRMIILATEKGGLDIGSRLLAVLPKELERIVTSPTLADVSAERLAVTQYCEGIDLL